MYIEAPIGTTFAGRAPFTLEVEFIKSEGEVKIERDYKCWDCKDSGEVEKYTWDTDHQANVWDGYKPCLCQI